MRTLPFTKGHGTHNDFVILEDRANMFPISGADVRFLCDRRGGVGGDGILRVTRAVHIPEWDGPDMWFMDYRNADGSIAEMCGNGLRVFGRYIYDAGLVGPEPVAVGTRAGIRWLEPHPDGHFRVEMGRVIVGPRAAQGVADITVTTANGTFAATAVDVGNPHAVVLLPAEADLAAIDLREPPAWSPPDAFPHGVNVEFVQSRGERHVAMRVFERGSGETMSCGTGTVAAASAFASSSGNGEESADGSYVVDVPGGRVVVDLLAGDSWLSGPTAIVANGVVHFPN